MMIHNNKDIHPQQLQQTNPLSLLSKNSFNYILSYLSISDLYLNCSLVSKSWFIHIRVNPFFQNVYMPLLRHQHSTTVGNRLPFNVYTSLMWTLFIPKKPYTIEQQVYTLLYRYVNIKEIDREFIQINLPLAPFAETGQKQHYYFQGLFGSVNEQMRAEEEGVIQFIPVIVKRRENKRGDDVDDQSVAIHLLVETSGSIPLIVSMDYQQCLDVDLENFVEKGFQIHTIRFVNKVRNHESSSITNTMTQDSRPTIYNRALFQSLLTRLGLSETDESIPLATFILTIRDCFALDAITDEYKSPKASMTAYDHLYIDERSPFWFMVTKKLVKQFDRLLAISKQTKPNIDKLSKSVHCLIHSRQFESELPIIMYYIARYCSVQVFSNYLQELQLSLAHNPSALVKLFDRISSSDNSALVGLLQGYDQNPSQKLELLMCVLEDEEIKHLMIQHRVLKYAMQIAKDCPEQELSEYHSIITRILFEFLKWQQFPSDLHLDALTHARFYDIYLHIVQVLVKLPSKVKSEYQTFIREVVNHNQSLESLLPLHKAVLNYPEKIQDLISLGADPQLMNDFRLTLEPSITSHVIRLSALDEAMLYIDEVHCDSLLSMYGRKSKDIFSHSSQFKPFMKQLNENVIVNAIVLGRPKTGKRSLVDRIMNRQPKKLNNDMFERMTLAEQCHNIGYRSSSGLFSNEMYDEHVTMECDSNSVDLRLQTLNMFEFDGIVEDQPILTNLPKDQLAQARKSIQAAHIVLVCFNVDNELSCSILHELDAIKSLVDHDITLAIVGLGSGDASKRRVPRCAAKYFAEKYEALLFELKLSDDNSTHGEIIHTCLRHCQSYPQLNHLLEKPYRAHVSPNLSLLSPVLLPLNGVESNQIASLSTVNGGHSSIEEAVPYVNTVSNYSNHLNENVSTNDEKLHLALTDWNMLVHIARRMDNTISGRVYPKLTKYASTIVDAFKGPGNLLPSISSFARSVDARNLFLLVQLLSLVVDQESLITVLNHAMSEAFQSSCHTIQNKIALVDSILSIIGTCFYEGISTSPNNAHLIIFVQELRTLWLDFVAQRRLIEVESAVSYHLFNQQFASSSTTTVLFMLYHGFIDHISFMNHFYGILHNDMIQNKCGLIQQDFIQSASTLIPCRAVERCLYLINHWNIKEFQMNKVLETAKPSFSSSVLLLVNGLTYCGDSVVPKPSPYPIDVQTQLTRPYETIMSQNYFSREMEFLRLRVDTRHFSPRITWLYEYGSAELIFNTNYATKHISVSTIQMSTLLLFNDPVIHQNGLTLNQILEKLLPASLYSTDETRKRWRREILALVKSKILVPKEGADRNTTLWIITRENWEANRIKIKIPQYMEVECSSQLVNL